MEANRCIDESKRMEHRMSNMVGPGSKYTDEDRRRAIVEYLVNGNMTKVAKSTGIPRTTLSEWKQTEWWDNLVGEVRHEKEAEIQAQFSKIIEKSCEETLDRLENGDEVHTKDGIKRMKMKGRDLATVGGIIFDKLQLSLNRPTAISSKSGEAHLVELQARFKQIAKDYEIRKVNSIPGDCEEIPDSEALPNPEKEG